MSTARKVEDSERALSGVATLLRDGVSGEVPRVVHDQSRHAMLQALAARPRARPAILPWAAAAAAALVLMFVGSSVYLYEEPLAYHGFGAYPTQDGFIALDPSVEHGGVRFSDGTVVSVERGARVQVVDVDGRGAELSVEDGRARFQVVHKPRARWNVAAGPYSVEVTGTRFDLTWASLQRRFELSLEDGSVIVRGPQIPDGVRLTTGQKIVASSDPPSIRITNAAEAAVTEPALVPEVQELTPEKPRPMRVAPRPAESWTDQVRSGAFENVLLEARNRGIENVLRRATLSDLVALADAARYSHEVGLSRRALEAQRKRFARSTHARDAAFLLGRLSEDQGERPALALRWYDQYLREAPRGSFAPEALGRKMVVLHQQRGLTAAVPVARDYLARFPHGPYAARAQELTQAE